MKPVALVVGPAEHGVVRHAGILAHAAGWPVATSALDVPAGATVVLDVTDRLFGATAERSGPALAALGTALQARGCRVVAALHDIPRPGDDAVQRRRAGVYRTVLAFAAGVIVHSEHEAGWLRALGDVRPPVAVVPLPVLSTAPVPECGAGTAVPAAACGAMSVTVLGFVYPGKGHEEVLAAMAGLPDEVPLIVAGRAADGHADLITRLTSGARPVHVTGFLPDHQLSAWLQTATIPVAPHRFVSASGSIATWWSHGRRPLAPTVPYVQEVLTRNPGAVWGYEELAPALAAAWVDPGATWLPRECALRPTLAETVALRNAVLAGWAA